MRRRALQCLAARPARGQPGAAIRLDLVPLKPVTPRPCVWGEDVCAAPSRYWNAVRKI